MAYHPFRRLGLKAFSVTLAVLLWVIVAGDRVVERAIRVPLEYQNIPESIELLGSPPSTVDVRVRGRSGVLGRLDPGEVVLVLDLAAARPGTRLFHLLAGDVRTPFGVDVTDVLPSTVSLDFEQTSTRHVPVRPDTRGSPAGGYVVSTLTVSPPTVEVIGPESRVKRVEAATTDALSVEGATGAIVEVVTIGLEDAAVRLRTPQQAEVRVDIVPAEVERVIRGVPIAVRHAPPYRSVEVVPATAEVTLSGLDAVVNALEAEDLRVWVDCERLDIGQHLVPIAVENDHGYASTHVEPRNVVIRIR